jgi:SAM-dependent methyltransferase
MFHVLKKYCQGEVLDVGGRDFFFTAIEKKLPFKTWTTLENSEEERLKVDDPRYRFVLGDGCHMQLESDRFDTVLNIQVLEHVFEPIKMITEISRVLKPDGYAVFLIPQTSTLHMAPYHYHNFTRYWIKEAAEQAGLQIVELKPLGGVWSSMSSHLVYFFLQSFRFKGMSSTECERNAMFYLLFPLMALYALVNIPICLFLSLGDLTEEPNNHLVVARKP